MLDKISRAFAFEETALKLRGARQQILATNIANADTPNYKAADMDFAAELQKKQGSQSLAQLNFPTVGQTRTGHLGGWGNESTMQSLLYRQPRQSSLDGNTVEMETEMANFADNANHYQASLTILNERFRGLRRVLEETK